MKAFRISVILLAMLALFAAQFAPSHLKDLVIVEGIGIEQREGGYQVYAQVLNSNALSGQLPNENSTVMYDRFGKSVALALDGLQSELSKEMYFGHDKLITFSKTDAESGFAGNLPYLIGSVNARSDIAVCLAANGARELFESRENGARVPCENILHLLRNGEKSAQSVYVTASELLSLYENKTADIFLPVLRYSQKTETVVLDGIAVFSRERLSGVLTGEEIAGFLLLGGRLEEYAMEVYDERLGLVSLSLQSIHTKNDINLSGGDVILKSDIRFEVKILDAQYESISRLTKEDHARIKQLACRKAEHLCRETFFACQSCGSDCLRVGQLLAMKAPQTYDRLSESWQESYSRVKLSVSVSTP